MVPFSDVSRVLALPQPGLRRQQITGALHLGNGLRIGGVLVDGDRARGRRVGWRNALREPHPKFAVNFLKK